MITVKMCDFVLQTKAARSEFPQATFVGGLPFFRQLVAFSTSLVRSAAPPAVQDKCDQGDGSQLVGVLDALLNVATFSLPNTW